MSLSPIVSLHMPAKNDDPASRADCIDLSTIRRLTGGDKLTARMLYQQNPPSTPYVQEINHNDCDFLCRKETSVQTLTAI